MALAEAVVCQLNDLWWGWQAARGGWWQGGQAGHAAGTLASESGNPAAGIHSSRISIRVPQKGTVGAQHLVEDEWVARRVDAHSAVLGKWKDGVERSEGRAVAGGSRVVRGHVMASNAGGRAQARS